jgi:hypothetical protein
LSFVGEVVIGEPVALFRCASFQAKRSVSVCSVAENQIDDEKHYRYHGIGQDRYLPERQPGNTVTGGLEGNEVEATEPAVGISVGLLAATGAGHHLYFVSCYLPSVDELFATQSNDDYGPQRNKQIAHQVDDVAIRKSEVMSIRDKNEVPKVVLLVLNFCEG